MEIPLISVDSLFSTRLDSSSFSAGSSLSSAFFLKRRQRARCCYAHILEMSFSPLVSTAEHDVEQQVHGLRRFEGGKKRVGEFLVRLVVAVVARDAEDLDEEAGGVVVRVSVVAVVQHLDDGLDQPILVQPLRRKMTFASERYEDVWGLGKLTSKRLCLIVVPSTQEMSRRMMSEMALVPM